MQEINENTGETFTLSESHTILRYLSLSRSCPDHWYPANDLRQRALIDNYLDEHHNFLRQGVGMYIFKKLFSPKIAGKTYTDEELSENRQLLNRGLNLIEKRLDSNQYLCGNQVSIADLSAACELE